jgi:hypothetical protein
MERTGEFLPGDLVQNRFTGAISEVVKQDGEWLVIADAEGRFAVAPRAYDMFRRSA